MRISGALPATQSWKGVVRPLSDGADVAKVADATLDAASRAFLSVEKDVGFRETMFFLTELGLAGGSADATGELARLGIDIPENTSLAEVGSALSQELDRRIDATRRRSDLGEMAQQALLSALIEYVNGHLLPLLQPSQTDVLAAFKALGKTETFGAVARSFCAKLTDATLRYFLSRTLATHLGEGQRFTTTNQVSEFEAAMKTHCEEASAIMEKFAAEWFSKRRYLGKGKISREAAERAAWFAMQKMRLELEVRAKKNES